MEKAKISAYQLFTLIFLFEIGSALVVPLALGAKQDAWLAILIGMTGGFCLFFIYYGLYCYYPTTPPMDYLQKIMGSFFGKTIAFLYVLYFIYLAARVLRDFGEMIVTIAYPTTPLFIISTLFILVLIYAVYNGIEVISRTSEVLFIFTLLLGTSGFLLLIFSGNIEMTNLQPILEDGITPIIKTAFTETLYFPFGEVVVFAVILPYVIERKHVRRTGLLAIGISGLVLAAVMAINISVLGINRTSYALFPLLHTTQTIQVAGFLERLDVYFLLMLMIGGFFKIGIFFYVSVIATSNLFQVKHPSRLAYPIGIVVLLVSMAIASSFTEHIKEGVEIVPLYVHLPFQVILPVFLLIIAFFKNRKKAA